MSETPGEDTAIAQGQAMQDLAVFGASVIVLRSDRPPQHVPLGEYLARGRCYTSPIPARFERVYDQQIADYVDRRFHYYPQPDGREIRCKPGSCRECWREEQWHDHGEAK